MREDESDPQTQRTEGLFLFFRGYGKSKDRFQRTKLKSNKEAGDADDYWTNRNRCIQEEGLLQARRWVWIGVALSLGREGCRRSRPKGTPALLLVAEYGNLERRKNVWRKGPCPECAADIPLARDIQQGAIVQCPYCWVELVVRVPEPLMLELAPEEAEYWAE